MRVLAFRKRLCICQMKEAIYEYNKQRKSSDLKFASAKIHSCFRKLPNFHPGTGGNSSGYDHCTYRREPTTLFYFKYHRSEIKKRLSVSCDNQPFIASAPFVLIFCADC